MLRAAIAGLGWWGTRLVESVQSTSARIRFTKAATLEPASAAEFAARYGLNVVASFDEALVFVWKIRTVVSDAELGGCTAST